MSFVNEIDYYMDCQQREQGRKLTGKIPTVAEYWETRLGTSAVTSMLALNEYERLHMTFLISVTSKLMQLTNRYADGSDGIIPRYIMTNPKMIDLWREVNLNMSL